VFKIVIFTPLQIWLVYSIDQKMKVCESFLSYLLVSIYAFGYGVNQSVNAIDSFLSRLQVANPRLKLNADVNAAIYFWDEKVGHIISSIAFFAFQIKWLAEINDGLRAIGPRELEELYEEQGMSKIFAAVGPEGTQALAVSKGTRPVTRSGEGTRNEVAICKEFFTDFTDNPERNFD